EDQCTGCGKCEEVCPAGVFKMVDEISKVEEPDECTECGACVDECPSEAINLE
ncbi:MAG: 4Fe-4S dicluster domain-containing protein, partial [Euryarchaeota archaeon]|nr:4Fe-4S dicluster domain-containing protein [Euryarchaeota archaeon]